MMKWFGVEFVFENQEEATTFDSKFREIFDEYVIRNGGHSCDPNDTKCNVSCRVSDEYDEFAYVSIDCESKSKKRQAEVLECILRAIKECE